MCQSYPPLHVVHTVNVRVSSLWAQSVIPKRLIRSCSLTRIASAAEKMPIANGGVLARMFASRNEKYCVNCRPLCSEAKIKCELLTDTFLCIPFNAQGVKFWERPAGDVWTQEGWRFKVLEHVAYWGFAPLYSPLDVSGPVGKRYMVGRCRNQETRCCLHVTRLTRVRRKTQIYWPVFRRDCNTAEQSLHFGSDISGVE
jgi:hypothetical protein